MTRKRQLPIEERQKRIAEIDALLAATNAAGGEQVTKLNGTSGRWPDDKIIRTGSLDLDMSLGIGGLPRGRVCEVYGVESAGKTTLLLHIVTEAQRAGMNVLFIDAENALDPDWAKRMGVDLDRWLINQPDSLQSAQDLIVHAMKESAGDDVNDLLVIVDSIPALAPSEVMEASAEQQTRALAARYWSAQLPKIAKAARESNSTLVLINQMRDSMDMYTPASTPGGRAIKFYSSVRIELRRKVEGKGEATGAIGQMVTANVVKNKVGSPFKKAEFWLPVGAPINWVEDVITTSMAWAKGAVQSDTKYEYPESDSYEDSISKKGWFSVYLRRGWLDLMREDELERWLDANDEYLNEETGEYEYPEDYEEHTEDNFESELSDDLRAISVYRESAFIDYLSQYPSLVEAIESHLLDTLNEGSTGIEDVEEVPDESEPEDVEEPDED